MNSNFPGKLFKQTAILLLFFSCFLTAVPAAFAQPVMLDSGMDPNQTVWAFDRNTYGADQKVTFWIRIQKQSIYDYYFKAQIFRPDGSEVWNVTYGFDTEGYAAEKLTFPIFFYNYSPNKLSPSFGIWKVRTAVVDRNSKKEVSVNEHAIAFTDGKQQPSSPQVSAPGKSGNPFPVPSFQYKQWRLQNWGIGVFEEIPTGPNTYDKEIKALDVRDTFSVKEAQDAWSMKRKFGAILTGPPVNTYVNSNNMPLYVFGYILKHPGGESDGQKPQYRTSSYCNNPGTVLFPFDVRKPGRYRMEFLLRERDKPSWEESSWVPIGGLDFTLTK
ncbi:MAG: hypothetical protein CVU71_13915 [Deltaproteobacteria bacterium HGW-Deltaproteobacteria-6]|jgi:hypothetical protein|nr:MAG: hypothetical protein CVU71_13915 [Deltaproteobacteria bacterium HGW-Deltaproteobacteria-6]